MNSWWQMWAGALTAAECQDIVDRGLRLPAQNASVGFGAGNRQDAKMRRSTVRWVLTNDRAWRDVVDRLDWYFRYANDAAFGFDLSKAHELQFTEYDAGVEGHYDWHLDHDWKDARPAMRKLSLVLQLTDPADYEGGELQLQEDALNEEAKANLRKRGTVIVFPAFNRHRVTPVTRGRRYSMVSWMQGPQFR